MQHYLIRRSPIFFIAVFVLFPISSVFSMEKSCISKQSQKIQHKKKASFDPLRELEKNPRAFHEACLNGEVDKVQAFIDAGIDVNTSLLENPGKGRFQFSCALACCSNISLEAGIQILDLLLNNGLNINSCDADQDTPLHIAAHFGLEEVVEYLLNRNASIDLIDSNKLTPIDLAIEKGHFEVVKYLVQNRPLCVDSRNGYGNTPLHMAGAYNQLEIFKYMLESGADINAVNFYGINPVGLAIANGRFELLKYVVEERLLDISSKNSNGDSPLHVASHNQQVEIFKYLLKNGADIDTTDDNGLTVTDLAIGDGDLALVKYLAEKRLLDLNRKCVKGDSLLHMAVANKQLEIYKYLLESGADISAVNDDNITSFELAVCKGQLEIVKYLVENKLADINSKGARGNTPLCFAVLNKQIEMMRYLIDKGADINGPGSNNNSTPLDCAIKEGHLDIAKWILRYAAGSIKNPLFKAIDDKEIPLIEALLDLGVNISEWDEKHQTPLIYSIDNYGVHRQYDITELLIYNCKVRPRPNTLKAIAGSYTAENFYECIEKCVKTDENDPVSALGLAEIKSSLLESVAFCSEETKECIKKLIESCSNNIQKIILESLDGCYTDINKVVSEVLDDSGNEELKDQILNLIRIEIEPPKQKESEKKALKKQLISVLCQRHWLYLKRLLAMKLEVGLPFKQPIGIIVSDRDVQQIYSQDNFIPGKYPFELKIIKGVTGY